MSSPPGYCIHLQKPNIILRPLQVVSGINVQFLLKIHRNMIKVSESVLLGNGCVWADIQIEISDK